MPPNIPPMRTQLYAPGNNARMLEKVFGAGSDAVVLDLEDAVQAGDKVKAREMVREMVRSRANKPSPITLVRVNHPATGLTKEDVRAVVQPGLAALRLPKMEDAASVRQIAAWVDDAEVANGVAPGSIALICGIESAAGVLRALDIATAHPRVLTLSFGAADFSSDVGITPGPEGLETLLACSQLVLVCRMAGLRPPVDTVYRFLDDPAGLEQAAQRAKALGFFGKSVIHPKQVPIVNAVFTPTGEEIMHARRIVQVAQQAEARGRGAVQDAGGEFVDIAVVKRAKAILALAASLDKHTDGPVK